MIISKYGIVYGDIIFLKIIFLSVDCSWKPDSFCLLILFSISLREVYTFLVLLIYELGSGISLTICRCLLSGFAATSCDF